MKSNFNWGIIGPGRIATRFAEGLSHPQCGSLYAVASRDKVRAKDFAAKYNATHFYDSYQQLLDDENVDGIYIATPHNFHFEQIQMCIRAGKAVLCEKPLTVNAQQTQALIALANEHQVFFMEALWTRFLPIYQQVKSWLSEIGQLHLIRAEMGFIQEKNPHDRLFDRQLAGGALLDLGVYCLSLAQWATQRPAQSISAQAILGDTSVDELTLFSVDYGDQCMGQFAVSFMSELENKLVFYGSKGKIEIQPYFWQSITACKKIASETICKTLSYKYSGFEYQIMEAEKCSQTGCIETPFMSHAHSLEVMRQMDEIRRQIGLVYPQD